jgi:hypothetical protein
MANNDIRLTALTLGGRVIPLSGEQGGVVATLTPDPVVVSQNGVSQRIYSHVNNATGTLTITAYPQDPAYPVMMALYQEQRALRQSVLAGTAILSGAVATWPRGAITQAPPLNREEAASATTWTIEVDGLDIGASA